MDAEIDTDRLLGEVYRHGGDIKVEDADLVLYGGERIPAELKANLKENKGALIRNLSAAEDRLMESLTAATNELPITSQDVYETLDPGDIAAWRNGELSGDNLKAFALAVHERCEREAGRIPDSYEDIAICDQCGPVWWFTSGAVPSCPWCFNRLNGWPIPRPGSVTCATCQHFQRTEHPNLGHCGAGIKPYGLAVHWDTDRHGCKHWLSNHGQA